MPPMIKHAARQREAHPVRQIWQGLRPDPVGTQILRAGGAIP